MSNAELRAAPPAPQEEEQALKRILEQFQNWRELSPQTEQAAQRWIDEAFEANFGSGIESEVFNLEMIIEESIECRQKAFALHQEMIDHPDRTEALQIARRMSVNAATSVRASAQLTVKREELRHARRQALHDAAARLDRMLRRGIDPAEAARTAPRPLLSARIESFRGGSVVLRDWREEYQSERERRSAAGPPRQPATATVR